MKIHAKLILLSLVFLAIFIIGGAIAIVLLFTSSDPTSNAVLPSNSLNEATASPVSSQTPSPSNESFEQTIAMLQEEIADLTASKEEQSRMREHYFRKAANYAALLKDYMDEVVFVHGSQKYQARYFHNLNCDSNDLHPPLPASNLSEWLDAYNNVLPLTPKQASAEGYAPCPICRSESAQEALFDFYYRNEQDVSVTATPTLKPTPTVQPVPTAAPASTLAPLPASGTTRYYTQADALAPLTVSVPNDGNYYFIVLSNLLTGKRMVTLFLHSGETDEIHVPLGRYRFYYCYGKEWYGAQTLFGESGSYRTAEDILAFTNDGAYYNGYDFTLYPTADGNWEPASIGQTEFPAE